jgi:16S rRNA (guanine527-N7)-methyltransferase
MTITETLKAYFPDLGATRYAQFEQLPELYNFWNEKINVISRKDMEHFVQRHVLHSLSIALIEPFYPQQRVLDIGTGGGFPGIPLAILFPDVDFTLVDSIGKKIQVVQEVTKALGLMNVRVICGRAEALEDQFDAVMSRAVAPMMKLANWSEKKLDTKGLEPKGYFLLKGGDLESEIADFKQYYPWYKIKQYSLDKLFSDEFFETKKLVRAFR